MDATAPKETGWSDAPEEFVPIVILAIIVKKLESLDRNLFRLERHKVHFRLGF